MTVDARRVVQVFAPVGEDGQGITPSGYLIAEGLVLTARHVVEKATRSCEARSLGSAEWVVASQAWLGEECDAALLAVDPVLVGTSA